MAPSLPKNTFHNDKGEKFIIQVNSNDKAAVEEYVRNLQVYLEYTPISTTVASTLEAKTIPAEENETAASDILLNNSLEVVIKATKPLEPKFLNFRFQDSINRPIEPGINYGVAYKVCLPSG